MPSLFILVSGKKFMWDGVEYPIKEQALENMEKYKNDGFEVEMREEGEKSYLYTRRVVKEVVTENP